MTAVAVTVTVLLAVAGGLTLTRIIRGPSILDRAVATDVLLAVIVAAIATEAAYSRDATALPVLVVLAVLGFVGSVSVARFAARRHDESTSSTSDGSQT
ncbi:monovalent cation/H+ antiporter complex subunit F [Micromonospora sp. NPDC049891]|uniref:monovalent cation/H+ antiporter complex subunit F n=1 Tax=Micromonospora sp. NPDC049891 TaxID=3155655 RepID=UPI0033DFE83C